MVQQQAAVSYIEENCMFTHEGQEFTSGGAVVTDRFITAYLGKDGVLTDWHGKQIGKYRVLSSWRTPRSYVSSHMYSCECFVDGVRYVGRGAGEGMCISAKRSTRQ